jgi:hypothetical protein
LQYVQTQKFILNDEAKNKKVYRSLFFFQRVHRPGLDTTSLPHGLLQGEGPKTYLFPSKNLSGSIFEPPTPSKSGENKVRPFSNFNFLMTDRLRNTDLCLCEQRLIIL